MEPLLTLVIALGGIATGIGAIWAALVAKRQAQLTERSLSEQRQFLKEQNEIARRQTQLTEQSLAEQNERLRRNLALDLLTRLHDRFQSSQFRTIRSKTAKFLLDNVLVEDRIIAVEYLNKAAWVVVDFFVEVGYLHRMGALQDAAVRSNLSWFARAYWLLFKPTLEKLREEWQDPALYEQMEYFYRLMADMERERGIEPPTLGQLREMMEYEAFLDEEPPTTTD